MKGLNRRRDARRAQRRTVLAGLFSVAGIIALGFSSRAGSPVSPPDALGLQVSTGGEVREEGELLYDPGACDGFAKLRQRLVGGVKVPEVRGDRAYVALGVWWEPHHAIINGTGQDDGLGAWLEIVETWTRVEGQWFWLEVERSKDFFPKHPELKDR